MSAAGVLAGAAMAALALAQAACAPDHGRENDPDGGGGLLPDGNNNGIADSGGNGFIDAIPLPDGAGMQNCNILPAKIRDFRVGPGVAHPDFEHFTTDAISAGIVATTLGADGTPTWATPGVPACSTGATEFAQWYHDVPGVNMTIPIEMTLTQTPAGAYVFDNAAFFPADGLGFGNEGFPHNYGFTTEIHTSFKYMGGESFTFRGDDDLWLFINGKLAIDLGGLHQPQQMTLSLDARAVALGIVVGGTYHMDIFGAERHSTASNFRIETTIDCLVVP